ncbi:solute carrier family 25 member 45-like [Pecten maximus]|uniref:solute carrier family 25 member 45-like n=1 Tax=Pecten maximus TaxID=6579 RepID=UPI001458A730|nr:solute carrier family 25 member 45-like [Pecten maximus]XP_033735584.1 solute carrier family 25 member 45-like [Pecten maximus]XP_033735585.1 solute carrier family 25 member 45-like [Pecten maximus]XP_033735586.1 solute carrier family 25 member 45-like [Pecten maximus]
MEKGSSYILNDYLSGAIAGSVGVVSGHPFDTVKVQLQVQSAENKYKSLLDCVSTVRKQKLSKGFFRGLSWPMFSAGVINSVYFGVYGYTLKVLGGNKEENSTPPYLKILFAGCLGGVVQLIPACPAEVIKVVLQSQIPHGNLQGAKFYKGPLEGAAHILRLHGLRGMYRGLPTQCIRDVPANGIYFLTFEFLTFNGSSKLPFIPAAVQNFFAGGIAGVLSWMAIIPFDVVKSRLQADCDSKRYKGFLDCALACYRQDGLSVFFRGLSMVALRAFPVNAVTFMVYVESMKLLGEEVSYA